MTDYPAMAPVKGGAVPYLQVDGAIKAAHFYEQAFGATIAALHPPDDQGRTMLHIAVQATETPADIALLLERGADRTIRDKNGKRAVDLVPRSLKEIRALLT